MIVEDIVSFFSKFSFSNTIKDYFSISNGLSFINTGTDIIIKVIIVIVLIIYFIFNIEYIVLKFERYELFNMINRDLYTYYKGFYLIMIIEIIEYFVVYLIIGHPYFIFIAFLSGFSNIIPNFGAMFTNLVALITSYNISRSLFFKTSLVMIFIPLINNYYVEPRVYNKTLKISFITIILSILVFGKLFGVFGVVFGIPLYIIIKNIIKYRLINN